MSQCSCTQILNNFFHVFIRFEFDPISIQSLFVEKFVNAKVYCFSLKLANFALQYNYIILFYRTTLLFSSWLLTLGQKHITVFFFLCAVFFNSNNFWVKVNCYLFKLATCKLFSIKKTFCPSYSIIFIYF